MAPDLGWDGLAALGAVGLVAGFFDAIAGGGGLMTVPALLLAGLDPVAAVATNKLQGVFGTASATLSFARAGRIDWRAGWPMAVMAALGGGAGALTVRYIDPSILAGLVPLLLIAIALYFALGPRIGDADVKRRMAPALFAGTLVPFIGFYDGFFGPGAGSFYMVGFVTLLGLNLVSATGQTKLLNVSSNGASLALFILSGAVVWPVGLAMAAGSFVGAQLGARVALRFGARLIRPLLILVCCAVAGRLLLNPENPLRRAILSALG